MSDKRNQPPGSEPADGDQPDGPPGRGTGEGQSATWWTGDTEAKREFQSPAAGERPVNNWFAGGWSSDRREHPDEPTGWQTSPEQSRPASSQPGPSQRGASPSGPAPQRPSQQGPARPGPSQSGPPPGPPYSAPSQAGQSGAGPAGRPPQPDPSVQWQAAPDQWGRGPRPGPAQQFGPGRQSGPTQQSGPGQQSRPGQQFAPQQPGPAWSATDQSQSSAWQSTPSQPGSPRQQDGPHSEGSYLWGSGNQNPDAASPWSNALPPQQQRGPRHSASQGGQGGQLGPMGQPVQQPPTWQYPPIPIPQPPGGRRRKPKKTSRAVLIGLVVLAVLVVGTGLTLIVRNAGNDEPQVQNTPTAAPTETSQTPSESPSPSPSPTPTRPPGPTVDEVVQASPLYRIGPVAASKCAEPPFAPVTVAAAQTYYNRLLPCLSRTWWLAMKKVNLPFRVPKAVVYVGKAPSPCGVQRSVRAAYCGANETIYLPFAVDNAYYKSNPMYARAIMLNTFAHEYGHHVQKLSGILASSMTRQQKMTANQKLAESRRRELQATCLGAVYLGANAAFVPMRGPLLENWKFLIAHTGDDYARPRVHDHGNRVSNYQWSIAGYNTKKPDSCNTFTAADLRVA